MEIRIPTPELQLSRRLLNLAYSGDDLAKGNEWSVHGERLFAEFLLDQGAATGQRYWLINRLCLVEGSDIDHLLVGPTGIHVYESKFWQGLVVCRDGHWAHWRYEDGAFVPVPINQPPDLQAIQNMEDVASYLHARLPGVDAGLSLDHRVPIRGGVVFTYPGAQCIFHRPLLACATLDFLRNHPDSTWALQFLPWGAPIIPQFDQKTQLLVVRTLIQGHRNASPRTPHLREQALAQIERELDASLP